MRSVLPRRYHGTGCQNKIGSPADNLGMSYMFAYLLAVVNEGSTYAQRGKEFGIDQEYRIPLKSQHYIYLNSPWYSSCTGQYQQDGFQNGKPKFKQMSRLKNLDPSSVNLDPSSADIARVKDITWNVMGMMNNPWFRIKVYLVPKMKWFEFWRQRLL